MAEKAIANSAPQVAAPSGPSKLTIVLGFAAIGGCLVILGVLADTIKAQEADALDALATPLVHQYASPTLDAFMNDLTALGSNQGLVVLFVVAAASLLALRRRRDALLLAVALGGSVALNALMKAFFERPRPQLAWALCCPTTASRAGIRWTRWSSTSPWPSWSGRSPGACRASPRPSRPLCSSCSSA